MTPEWVNVVLPIATLIIGAAGTLLTESRRDARASERAKSERETARSEARKDRHDTFELDTLVRAYGALVDLGHTAGMLATKLKTGGGGAVAAASESDGQLFLEQLATARRAVDLLLDDAIRGVATSALTGIAQAVTDRKIRESDIVLATAATPAALDMIARRIRQLYSSLVTTP